MGNIQEYQIGDRVLVRIHTSEYDQIPCEYEGEGKCPRKHDLIETTISGYLKKSQIEYSILLKIGWNDVELMKKFGVKQEHLNERHWAIFPRAIEGLVKPKARGMDGCFCLDCKKFCEMAAVNRIFEGKEVMLCYGCRTDRAWKWQDLGLIG